MAKKTNSEVSPMTENEETTGVDFAAKLEETRNEPAPKKGDDDDDEFQVVTSGASFWKFEENPVFIGTFNRPVIREKDGVDADTNENQKAGSVMGYEFVDDNGEYHIIGNSATIEKVMKSDAIGLGTRMRFKFIKQTKNQKNQKVNVFEIAISKRKI